MALAGLAFLGGHRALDRPGEEEEDAAAASFSSYDGDDYSEAPNGGREQINLDLSDKRRATTSNGLFLLSDITKVREKEEKKD